MHSLAGAWERAITPTPRQKIKGTGQIILDQSADMSSYIWYRKTAQND